MIGHKSDCAVHNEPAFAAGACDCGACEEVRATLTAKDAEIERLQGVLREIADQDPVEAALAPDWAILRAKAALTTETHERGDVGRQDRRSGASAHGEPSDTPTGDTR